jgi:TIR domain
LEKISFKSFLSHRYKSPEINLYFFKLFSEDAEVQFEIDAGDFSLNVTRLERMIRDSDAFIGIYPFPGTQEESKNAAELKKKSKYFRLEIDLAFRSQKPSLIFYDKRYGDILALPDNMFSLPFDFNELTSEGGFPNYKKHKGEFRRFLDAVKGKKEYDDAQKTNTKNKVALYISTIKHEAKIKALLEKNNYSDVEIFKAPLSLNVNFFKTIEKTDLAIAEIDNSISSAAFLGYLHGASLPVIRIKNVSDEVAGKKSEIETVLFEGVEVGYTNDILCFSDIKSLIKGLSVKLELIKNDTIRINTYDEAAEYFAGAKLKNEYVFVSYSGNDRETAKEIVTCLKKYYKNVFDYRDGESIEPGQPWLDEIFNKLAKSAIGISLLSNSYLQSENCMHEARKMVAQKDSKKLKWIPIKLLDEKLELPSFMDDLQLADLHYLRKLEYNSVDVLVKKIISWTS